ncbi:GTP-binding protein [Rhodothalassium salexigens DSM 2132]|uniref:Probable GTP-binding protein EngB n=1 Tax=Rhodothalassium salexigens DSM 2132 TaxID=1188247 RepID=A0A4R2PQC1_RHOSA|nr:ribosome biogenesis GTP-binding protein YihA/YsxC [Rhodothalassium salexigens]MBB4210931.1 GTP-binding protein [Rhodothalassium salexigens DSM 2132]MBK1639464.1 YihA family ribosome biogenesis GTP-binding protein [Rhodothalassium salexigens DSM 2132]TCP36411.1 GTP-binding protein [Rhodothalassium salexigens DSM 2132]
MTAPEPETVKSGSGAVVFRRPARFVKGVVDLAGLPDAEMTEVAMAGRSNVGKSSLINALTGTRNLARTSNTPGRTQEINFFDLDGHGYMVDLPGYGYAKESKTKVAAWNVLIRDYLRGRPTLMRVFLLIDARHGLKPNDEEIMKLLDQSAVNYQIVLTKTDKIKPGEREAVAEQTTARTRAFAACHPVVLATSSEKRWGLEAVRDAVAAALKPA